jgi:hypothetical protein
MALMSRSSAAVPAARTAYEATPSQERIRPGGVR